MDRNASIRLPICRGEVEKNKIIIRGRRSFLLQVHKHEAFQPSKVCYKPAFGACHQSWPWQCGTQGLAGLVASMCQIGLLNCVELSYYHRIVEIIQPSHFSHHSWRDNVHLFWPKKVNITWIEVAKEWQEKWDWEPQNWIGFPNNQRKYITIYFCFLKL